MKKFNRFGVILLLLFVMSLQACQTVKPVCQTVKPVLKSTQANDRDGISLDKADTEALMIYIKQLQRCAGSE